MILSFIKIISTHIVFLNIKLHNPTAFPKAAFPLGEFVRANRKRSNLIGWRQTLTTSPVNHIRFLLVRANKFAKWKTGLTSFSKHNG